MKDCLKISHLILPCYIILAESLGIGSLPRRCLWGRNTSSPKNACVGGCGDRWLLLEWVAIILQPRLKNGTFFLLFLHLIQIRCDEGWCTTKYRISAIGLQFVTSLITKEGRSRGAWGVMGRMREGRLSFIFLLSISFIFLLPSFRASRKMPLSPRLAHKAPVMQATP